VPKKKGKAAEPLYWVPEFMYVDWERPHLGGYLIGGDPGSFLPELWAWLIDEMDVKMLSISDVGRVKRSPGFADVAVKSWA
jgi:hypothetical protein